MVTILNITADTYKQMLQGILKGGSITVLLTSCLTGLESAVWQLIIFVFICKTDWFKPVKQEGNSTVILPPLVFPHIKALIEMIKQNLSN